MELEELVREHRSIREAAKASAKEYREQIAEAEKAIDDLLNELDSDDVSLPFEEETPDEETF